MKKKLKEFVTQELCIPKFISKRYLLFSLYVALKFCETAKDLQRFINSPSSMIKNVILDNVYQENMMNKFISRGCLELHHLTIYYPDNCTVDKQIKKCKRHSYCTNG